MTSIDYYRDGSKWFSTWPREDYILPRVGDMVTLDAQVGRVTSLKFCHTLQENKVISQYRVIIHCISQS